MHDNSVPSRKGAYTISAIGKLSYWPIETAGYMRPAMSLVIFEDEKGNIMSRIETLWPRELNITETE